MKNCILDIISIVLSALAMIVSAVTYLMHDRKLKRQEEKINNYQLKQINRVEEENKKACVSGTTHTDKQNATILTITNTGKSVARNIWIQGLDEGRYCFYGPDILPYELLNPGESFPIKFTVNINNLYKETITYHWDDDFQLDNSLQQTIIVR